MPATRSNAFRNLNRRWRTAELVATLALLGAPAHAQNAQPYGPPAPAMPEDLQKLRDEIKAQQDATRAQLDAQAAELERLRKELSNERAERAATDAEARRQSEETRRSVEKIALVRSRNLQLTLSGFVQADGVAWAQASQDQLNPSTAQPLNKTRFLIRRARLRADLEYQWIAGALELDGNTVNGAQARIIGAEASFRWRNPDNPAVPYLQITIGLFKTPFGFEIQQSDRDRLFLERSNAERALFPGEYDLGAKIQGGWRFLRYQLAAMNGDPIGEKSFPLVDPNQSKDFVGRVGVDFSIMKKLGLRAGFSADYGQGFHKNVAATKDQIVWRDTNVNGLIDPGELQVIPGMPAIPAANFTRWGLGADLELSFQVPKLGELFLYGEIVYCNNLDRATVIADPVALGRDQRGLGFYVGATLELTKWALVGVRYDRYDADRDANDLKNGIEVPKNNVYSQTAIAAAVQYWPWGRLVLEYDHNTNPLGRSVSGAVVTLPDDSFTIRGQVAF
jgi:hypothetical protein